MTSGGNLLSYNIYTDAARANVWGDGTGGTVTIASSTGTGAAQNVTVYGRVPTGQTGAAGRLCRHRRRHRHLLIRGL